MERCFGKPVIISESAASRYYPMPPKDFSSWMWHHDCLGKRINVMILLTDVGDNDQYMSYLKGSHEILHPYPFFYGYANSRLTDEDLRRYPPYEKKVCTGGAGAVFIFDSNGIHRGNRNPTRHRDTLISSYCCSREITKVPVRRSAVDKLTETQRRFLLRNPRVEIRG